MKLSMPKYGSGKRKLTQISFGGYNHNRSASEGEIYDMKNLTSDDYPILSVRKRRWNAGDGGDNVSTLGMIVYDNYSFEVGILNGESIMLCATNHTTKKQALVDMGSEDPLLRRFAFIGGRLVIMPDKKYINISEISNDSLPLHNIEASVSAAVTIGDGTYGGVDAKANMITFPEGTDLSYFRVGDAVTISGCTVSENNKTPIIEQIDGNKLIFLENVFTVPDDAKEYTEDNVTVARLMPDLDYICEHDNRLWGCKGDTIYCSKLGDPLNWNAFEGSAGAWATDVISVGDFTGCASFGGYVYFFKEENIYKVYGNRPANFQISEISAVGVKKGSWKSLAYSGGVLFYHSRTGIMAFSGGIPQNISGALGEVCYESAVGGSDGLKYYVSMREESLDPGAICKRALFVYDIRRGIWMKEDEEDITDICFDKRLYLFTSDRRAYTVGTRLHDDPNNDPDPLEGDFSSFVEFGDFYEGSPSKKVISKLYARIELEEGAHVTFSISFDGGKWKNVSEISAPSGKRSFTLPIIPRRCDHYRIRIEGEGVWRLYSLSRESHAGSDL